MAGVHRLLVAVLVAVFGLGPATTTNDAPMCDSPPEGPVSGTSLLGLSATLTTIEGTKERRSAAVASEASHRQPEEENGEEAEEPHHSNIRDRVSGTAEEAARTATDAAKAAGKYIPPERKEGEGDTEERAKYIVAPLATYFMIVFVLINVMEHFEITMVPDTLIVILTGIPLGFFLQRYSTMEFLRSDEGFGETVSVILNLMLLPIIVFNGAWTTRRQDFFSQLPYILMFAVVGTGISTLVIGLLIWITGIFGLQAVDPLLNILVFGESTVNDAVSIVLFNVLNSNIVMGAPSGPSVSPLTLASNIVSGIVRTCVGSLIIGICLAVVYILIVRVFHMRENKGAEVLYVFVSCYLTFAFAESMGYSGILSTLFCSFIMGIYMQKHLSVEGSLLTGFFLNRMSALADCCVFLLCGISVVKLDRHGTKFAGFVAVFCLIARLAATIQCGWACNTLKKRAGEASGHPESAWNLIDTRRLFMIWHAGLRGAIALVLSLELGDWVDELNGKGTRSRLQTATFLIICVFLLVFGGTTTLFLKLLDIPVGVEAPPDALSKTEGLLGKSHKIFAAIDENLFGPLLVGQDRMNDKEYEDIRELGIEEVLKRSAKSIHA